MQPADFLNSLYVVLNAVLCIGGLIMCLCRGIAMDANTTKPTIRRIYVVESAALVASLLSVFVSEVSGIQVLLVAANVIRLWLNRAAWAGRKQPDYARVTA